MSHKTTWHTQCFTEYDLSQAVSILKKGELLGIPTETVYGLAANALDASAVEKIFQVKARPSDNPLILHVAHCDWMLRYSQNIPEMVWDLADKFWPGPLTFVLDAKEQIPMTVTAGLPTVGLRCPNHPLTLALIQEADIPLAAPSGNLSGKPSPTTAKAMFEDMAGKIPAILDGGACSVGVESTILAFGETPYLLRAGGISVEEIESVIGKKVLLGKNGFHDKLEKNDQPPLAPGMKYRHYAPKAPVTAVLGENSSQWIAQYIQKEEGVICFQEYQSLFDGYPHQVIGKEKDFTTQAKQIFSALRYFDQTNVTHIWAQCPEEKGLGLAVANRLQKAAGASIISATSAYVREKR